MLVRVDVQNSHGSTLQLPLYGDDNTYQVEDIEGLDPVEVNFTTIKYSDVDGTEFQSAVRDERNIVITLNFNPDYATTEVSTLRSNLYSYFMPKQTVKLTFHDSDGRTFEINGRVESHDSPRFVKDPKSTISIICFDPDFISPTSTTVTGTTTSTNVTTKIDYPGTTETGFILTLTAPRTIGEIVFINTPYVGYTESLRFVIDMIAGDVLTLSTVVGSKSATLRRGGIDHNRMSGVSPYSVWPRLWQGENTLRVHVDGANIPYELTYFAKYGAL